MQLIELAKNCYAQADRQVVRETCVVGGDSFAGHDVASHRA
jgi:hypothetical protein